MTLRDTLKGTGVALITPFKNSGEIDLDALEKVIDYCIGGGVEYLVSLGTTGEASTLDENEKIDIINFTLDKVEGRVPLIVGIGGNNTKELLDNIRCFPLENATAILSASPYYSKPSQEGIYQHYKTLSENSPLPIILYNVPSRTGSNITAETVLRLANECEKIAGIKEASGNMVQCMHLLKNRPEHFLIVSGDDQLALPLIACGMDGVISVSANAFPEYFSSMIRYALEQDFINARQLHYKLLEATDLLFVENNPAGVKAFMAVRGLIENALRLPLVPLSKPFYDKVKVLSKVLFALAEKSDSLH